MKNIFLYVTFSTLVISFFNFAYAEPANYDEKVMLNPNTLYEFPDFKLNFIGKILGLYYPSSAAMRQEAIYEFKAFNTSTKKTVF